MIKQDAINSIQSHLNKHGRFRGYKSPKNKEYSNWINEYFKNTEIEKCKYTEKCWVLMHDEKIEHCITCGVKSIFGNFNQGYRSKHCKKCGSPEGYRRLAKKRKEESPEITITKKCKECDKEFSYKTHKLNNTINKVFCSKTCANIYTHKNMNEETKLKKSNKTKVTNLEKYGNEYVVNSKYTKKITKEKLGVEYAWQSKIILDKCKQTLYDKTGFYYPTQDPSTISKMMATKIERYGDYLIPMAKYKEYVMPSGLKIKIQGNESYALNILLQQYKEEDIIVGRKNIENEIGRIFYIGLDEKQHIYYPDIYIKSINKIIEVKSQFTYDLHKQTNLLKKEAILNKNIDFEFMILNGRKKMLSFLAAV